MLDIDKALCFNDCAWTLPINSLFGFDLNPERFPNFDWLVLT